MGCLFSQPKDGNHGAEYGRQDDPKGYAALRNFRQPFVAQWGGGRVTAVVRNGLHSLRWDKSVPALSNCSLDNNRGNGYLCWKDDDIVDPPDRWEMTVHLADECPDESCTVDLTPRHRNAFHPKPGQGFLWTNTRLSDKRVVGAGTVTVDPWGLVRIKQLQRTNAKHRLAMPLNSRR